MAKKAIEPVTQDRLAASEPLRYTEVKTALLMSMPFFGSILLDMMDVKVGKFPSLGVTTAGTDGKRMWIDEDFLKSLTVQEAVFLVCHEIGHAMWMHMPRGKRYADTGFEGQPFSQMLWNVAGDFVINAMLTEAKVGVMPKTGLLDVANFPGDMMVDDAYRKLLQSAKDSPKQPGEGDGDGDGSGSSGEFGTGKGEGKLLDTHVVPKDSAVNETEWKRAVESAASAAKAQGKLPASLERIVIQLLDPQVTWQDELQFTVALAAGRDTTTWSRPHRRRLVNQRVYLPAYTGFAMGPVVVSVDTSGSIGKKELVTFLSEVDAILTNCQPEKIFIIGCDAAVNSVVEMDRGDTLVGNIPKLGGGGGTSFCPPFQWVEDEGIDPVVHIYLTDMYGDFPEDPGYPVIWCSTTKDKTGPFGKTIYIDIRE